MPKPILKQSSMVSPDEEERTTTLHPAQIQERAKKVRQTRSVLQSQSNAKQHENIPQIKVNPKPTDKPDDKDHDIWLVLEHLLREINKILKLKPSSEQHLPENEKILEMQKQLLAIVTAMKKNMKLDFGEREINKIKAATIGMNGTSHNKLNILIEKLNDAVEAPDYKIPRPKERREERRLPSQVQHSNEKTLTMKPDVQNITVMDASEKNLLYERFDRAFESAGAHTWYKVFMRGVNSPEDKPKKRNGLFASDSQFMKENSIFNLGTKFSNDKRPDIHGLLPDILTIIDVSIKRGSGSKIAKELKQILIDYTKMDMLNPKLLESEINKLHSPALKAYMDKEKLDKKHVPTMQF